MTWLLCSVDSFNPYKSINHSSVQFRKTLFLPFGPQDYFSYTIIQWFFRTFLYKDDIYAIPIYIFYINILYVTIFLHYFLKNELETYYTKVGRGVCRNLFLSTTPPPLPPPYCVIALLLRAIILWVCRETLYHAATPRFFTRTFYTINGLSTLPNIVTEKLIIRPNQHGYLGSHAQQRRHLFYIFKRYYQFPMSSSLSAPRTPPAALKQSLSKRRKIL